MSVEIITASHGRLARGLGALLGLMMAAVPCAWAGPEIQHWQTDNGAQVYFVHAGDLPMVDVRVVFHAGSARDGGKAGLARLTNQTLFLGAGGLSADRIAERFDAVGASVGNGSERDMAWVSLRSLTRPESLGPALETLALALGQPRFPATDFERERKHALVAIEQQRQSPEAVADRAFYAALYGDHPYASPPLGTTASVKALTREDLRAFYQRYYVGRNAVVAVVGDLSRTQAQQLAQRLVGALPAGEAAPSLPEVKPLARPRTIRIPHPSSQTTVLIGQPGDYRGDPDYFPLYLGNHVLGGGGLVSRLNDAIREQRGLAYSVYSYFVPMARKGPFLMGTQTRNDQTGHAVDVMRQVLTRFVGDGPTAKELSAAKKNLTGGFPLRIDSNSKIVQYIAMLGFYGLPLDYLDRFTDRIRAVTADQIRSAFRRRLDPKRMVTVIVGGAG
jgi:zinc protease